MPGFAGSADKNVRLGDVVSLLRTLSGRHNPAARAASASASASAPMFTSLAAAVGPPQAPGKAVA